MYLVTMISLHPIGRTARATARRLSLLAACVVLACGEGSGTDVASISVSVQPTAALIVGVGRSADFDAVARDASGAPVSRTASWSVADPEVASVGVNGVITSLAPGKTTVSATIDGAKGTAQLEVYVPEDVAVYEPGVSYFGRDQYVEYIPGELPVVISSPHGGALTPNEIPDRTYGTIGSDRNTAELTEAVREALIELTGYAPHVIISRLHRAKLDPNREIVEAAQQSIYAEQAWHEFQDWISMARVDVEERFDRGMYFDMHGHGHAIDRLELGYLLGADELNQADALLNSIVAVASSSIRDLGRDSSLPFSQLLRGPLSFGGFLQGEGVRAVPSPGDPSPGAEPYFTGGYNTRRHGSWTDGEFISGIQIEHHFDGLRDTEENRRAYAAKLARVIRAFMLEHYGFFEPVGG